MIAYGPRGIEHGRKAMLKLSAKASGSKSARRGVLPWLIVGLYLSAAAARLWFSAHTHTAHATHSTMGPEHAHSLSVEGAHGLAESDEGGPGRQNAQHTNTPHTTLNTPHQNTQHTTPNTQHNAHSTQHSDPKIDVSNRKGSPWGPREEHHGASLRTQSRCSNRKAPTGGPERSTMGPLAEPKIDFLIVRVPWGGFSEAKIDFLIVSSPSGLGGAPGGALRGLLQNPKSIF